MLVAALDTGWEDVKIGADYEGRHLWQDRRHFTRDIHRAENIADRGWLHIRVTADNAEGEILRRARAAFARRA